MSIVMQIQRCLGNHDLKLFHANSIEIGNREKFESHSELDGPSLATRNYSNYYCYSN